MPVIGYVRGRARLWGVGALWGGILLAAFDIYAAAVTYVPQYAVRNDFRLMYGAALVGLRDGYSHLYDLAAQRAAVEGLGHGFYWSPYLNPAPLAWLATPFTLLPFGAAAWIWTAVLLAAAGLAWWLAAPGAGLVRAAHLALFLGLFPTAFGLMVGQPVALVALAVAAAWWLASRRHDVSAGLVLSLIVIKPQLALLVPVCLLVAGRTRIFVAWAVAVGAMGVITLAMLGGDGLQRYRDVLALAAQWDITRRYAIAGPLGLGPQVYAVQALVLLAALAAAWRQRGGDAGLPIATGLVASLLFTPYVGFQDFAMLVLAGWLVVRAGATAPQVVVMVGGYVLLELALLVLAVPILLAEAAFLVTLVWSRRWDSNPRPATYEAAALPAELRRQI